jgi:serine protease AprX
MVYGVTWTDERPIRRLVVALALIALVLSSSLAIAAARSLNISVPVIVRAAPGAEAQVERSIVERGGTIDMRLAIINGFRATLPGNELVSLASMAGVWSLTPDLPVRMQAVDPALGYDTAEDGSLTEIAKALGVTTAWTSGLTGKGIDVALIDTGVSPAAELAGRVVNGPDLSFDSQSDEMRYLDAYGHGTHLAGIIAGRPADLAAGQAPSTKGFSGIAPGARIVNVKVGAYDGATDVSQVLAAIDWVVQHRNTNGLNIRVLNLSFGTDSIQDYRLDPLTYAAEVAWRAGIVVVVAAGNEGFGSAHLNDPATDPFVIAVGADDMRGSIGSGSDRVPDFSSRGKGRFVDLVAPGKSVISLRAAGSYIDETYPAGRVGDRFFRGSGTSQATAVTSGAVALLLEQRPGLTPDQVKYMLRETASPMPSETTVAKGEGRLRLDKALAMTAPADSVAAQTWDPATGLGSLQGARGTLRLVEDDIALVGEQDIFGEPFLTADWAPRSADYTSWDGGSWMGRELTGDGWSNDSWTGHSWTGHSWTGHSWTGHSWTGHSWTGHSWTGHSWTGGAWQARSWTANAWAGNTWSSSKWGT